jgi:hypothetical protein
MGTERQPIIPNHYFAHVSSECQLLFNGGYYYGCIALSQSVAEALARFMYEKWTGKPSAETFGANINKLINEKVQPDISSLLKEIYGGQQRQDFHHLNKTVPTEYEQLRNIASKKIELLNEVETQVFACEFGNGLEPKYAQYWKIKDGLYEVYLRYNP